MMAGVLKMPLPIVEPTSTATALHRPRRRGRRSPQRSGGETGGADMRSEYTGPERRRRLHFGPYDATLHAARLGRGGLHLPAHRPRRGRAHHRLRARLRRALAALPRPLVPAAQRHRHPDRVESSTVRRVGGGTRRGGGGWLFVGGTPSLAPLSGGLAPPSP